jgi:hypothetical protein
MCGISLDGCVGDDRQRRGHCLGPIRRAIRREMEQAAPPLTMRRIIRVVSTMEQRHTAMMEKGDGSRK